MKTLQTLYCPVNTVEFALKKFNDERNAKHFLNFNYTNNPSRLLGLHVW